MIQTGDSAESVVRMMLQGSEVFLKISGSATKNIIVGLYALSKDTRNSKGKANLSKMLKSNKECKVFSIKEDELKTFDKQANAYGVMYCALVNKKEKSADGMVDLMVKAEDASKVNRIISRFNLSTIDRATIKSEAQKDIEKNTTLKANINEIVNVNNEIDKKPIKPNEKDIDPKYQGEKKKSPSKNSLNSNKKLEEGSKKVEKPSVKEKLKVLKAETNKQQQPMQKQRNATTKKPVKKTKVR